MKRFLSILMALVMLCSICMAQAEAVPAQQQSFSLKLKDMLNNLWAVDILAGMTSEGDMLMKVESDQTNPFTLHYNQLNGIALYNDATGSWYQLTQNGQPLASQAAMQQRAMMQRMISYDLNTLSRVISNTINTVDQTANVQALNAKINALSETGSLVITKDDVNLALKDTAVVLLNTVFGADHYQVTETEAGSKIVLDPTEPALLNRFMLKDTYRQFLAQLNLPKSMELDMPTVDNFNLAMMGNKNNGSLDLLLGNLKLNGVYMLDIFAQGYRVSGQLDIDDIVMNFSGLVSEDKFQMSFSANDEMITLTGAKTDTDVNFSMVGGGVDLKLSMSQPDANTLKYSYVVLDTTQENKVISSIQYDLNSEGFASTFQMSDVMGYLNMKPVKRTSYVTIEGAIVPASQADTLYTQPAITINGKIMAYSRTLIPNYLDLSITQHRGDFDNVHKIVFDHTVSPIYDFKYEELQRNSKLNTEVTVQSTKATITSNSDETMLFASSTNQRTLRNWFMLNASLYHGRQVGVEWDYRDLSRGRNNQNFRLVFEAPSSNSLKMDYQQNNDKLTAFGSVSSNGLSFDMHGTMNRQPVDVTLDITNLHSNVPGETALQMLLEANKTQHRLDFKTNSNVLDLNYYMYPNSYWRARAVDLHLESAENHAAGTLTASESNVQSLNIGIDLTLGVELPVLVRPAEMPTLEIEDAIKMILAVEEEASEAEALIAVEEEATEVEMPIEVEETVDAPAEGTTAE